MHQFQFTKISGVLLNVLNSFTKFCTQKLTFIFTYLLVLTLTRLYKDVTAFNEWSILYIIFMKILQNWVANLCRKLKSGIFFT